MESIIFNDDELIHGTAYEPTQVEPEAFTKKILQLIGYGNMYNDEETIRLDDAEEILLWIRNRELSK